MPFAINPTRMELIKLKKRILVAKRGHKLLREKRDGLMKHFLTMVKEARRLREKIDKELVLACLAFMFASADKRPEVIEEALSFPSLKISFEVFKENIMGVEIPKFKFACKGDWLCYGLVMTNAELDTALGLFSKSLADMVKLAEIEQQLRLLASEAERTRRRVNALEYVLIPNLEKTAKFISMKLEEQEMSAFSSLLRVKEVIR